jgi:hypothetical protein
LNEGLRRYEYHLVDIIVFIIVPTLSAHLYAAVLLSPLPVIPAGIAGIQGQGR